MSTGTAARYWFPAKRYGWGWGPPATWQGWAVLAAYLIAVVLGAPLVPGHHLLRFILWVAALTLVLIGVCWWKGEPPRWRWGD